MEPDNKGCSRCFVLAASHVPNKSFFSTPYLAVKEEEKRKRRIRGCPLSPSLRRRSRGQPRARSLYKRRVEKTSKSCPPRRAVRGTSCRLRTLRRGFALSRATRSSDPQTISFTRMNVKPAATASYGGRGRLWRGRSTASDSSMQ